ncbi:MAG TPA: grasp-with-spasm system ATP-grasp peptide maturase [Puia sp.]
MIIILSRQDDGNTHLVIEWLISLGKNFIRINSDDERTRLARINVAAKELIVEQNGTKFNLSDATSVWYRRRGLSIKSVQLGKEFYEKEVFPTSPGHHRKHMTDEMTEVLDFISFSLDEKCRVLGKHNSYAVNKLKVLEMAAKVGLKTPETFIITTKDDLTELMDKSGKGFITKAISNGVYLFTDTQAYYSYTEKLTKASLNKIRKRFFPSLVQVEIRKKFELRVFFLDNELYTMAIFSQKDEKTKVDFRKYNNSKPNRTVPFRVPGDIAAKIRLLMASLGLNTGSLDFIVDENDEFIFLEVNPVGQITMTSLPCNYYLEKKIAQYL